MIAAIWNLPLWALLPLMILTLTISFLAFRWGREVIRRARPLLFTPESLVIALLYMATLFGGSYAWTILQVSYLDRDVVIAGKK
jgi:hypothetical protein